MKTQRVIEYSVKVHTCRLVQEYGPGTLEHQMLPNNRYICVRNPRKDEGEEKSYLEEIIKEPEYYRMQPKCRCRKWITLREAIDLTDSGHAVWAYKVKKQEVERCEPGFPREGSLGHIWRPVIVGQTPRIDLITKADIERAYVGLVGPSIQKIEIIHEMHLAERALMFHGVVLENGRYKSGQPQFVDDPLDGRLLFPFNADQRTFGGHSH